MKRIDSVYDNSSVAIEIDNIQNKDSIRIIIGIADNGTLAVWNNVDGEQINIPLLDFSVLELVKDNCCKVKEPETREVIDYKVTCGVTHKHEYNPAFGTCPFCGKNIVARNIDFWNGIKCRCGAKIQNGKAIK